MATLERQVKSAREKLGKWVTGRETLETCGGLEGIGSLIRLASLDKDGSGTIEATELEELNDRGKQLVDQNLGLALNAGVISALLISILFPYGMEPIEITSEALDFFGGNSAVVEVMRVLYYVVLYFILGLAFTEMWATAFIYLALSSWMTNVLSQQTWIQDGCKLFWLTQSLIPQCLIIAMMVMVVFGTMIQSPLMGFLSLIAPMVFFTFTCLALNPRIGKSIESQMATARNVLGECHSAAHESDGIQLIRSA